MYYFCKSSSESQLCFLVQFWIPFLRGNIWGYPDFFGWETYRGPLDLNQGWVSVQPSQYMRYINLSYSCKSKISTSELIDDHVFVLLISTPPDACGGFGVCLQGRFFPSELRFAWASSSPKHVHFLLLSHWFDIVDMNPFERIIISYQNIGGDLIEISALSMWKHALPIIGVSAFNWFLAQFKPRTRDTCIILITVIISFSTNCLFSMTITENKPNSPKLLF